MIARRRPADTVRLPVADLLDPVIDELALAYAGDPDAVGALLRQHSARVLSLDLLAVDNQAEDWQRSMAAEQADATRAALLDESLTAEGSLDLDMTPTQADRLASDLRAAAANARRTNRKRNSR